MVKLFTSLVLAALLLSYPAQAQITALPGASGGINKGTTLPATCGVGDVFFDTDATAGQNIYGCTSANTWSLEGAAGSFGDGALATLSANIVLWDSANATRTLTAGLSGATDPVFTFGNNSIAITNAATFTKGGVALATVSDNVATASALAANPADCASNQFATTIAANGDLTCAAITDADVPNNITITLAATATALASNPTDCSANQFANAIAASGNLTCAAIADADVPDTITASNYLPLAGGTLTGQIITDNLGIEFDESDTNPTCSTGNYNIYADLSENKLKKCTNGVVSDLDTAASSGLASTDIDTSAELRTLVTDESGTGALLFANGAIGDATGTSLSFGADPADAGTIRNSNNTSLCWEAATPGTDICLKVNASDEFEFSAPINVTSTAAAMLLTGVTSPSAPSTAEQWYFYADSVDDKPKYIYNGGSEQEFYTTANPQTTISGNAGTATALASNPTDCSANQFANAIAASGNLTCAALVDADIPNTITVDLATAASGVTVSAGAAPTANGDIKYDSTANQLEYGDNGTNRVVVNLDEAQTLTNKTLTAPVIASISNSGTITVPTGTDTLVGKATTDILNNKTIDAEGTGNTVTIPVKVWLAAAGCQNATATLMWDTPTSNPAVAACITGTNTQKGVADFADSANLSMQQTLILPSDWTGNIDAKFKWLTSATSGSVVWQLATVCVADAETDDPAFNTASTVTDAAKGTTLQTNDATISTVTVTGCAGGELMHLKVSRDSAHASDSLAATARLIGVELTLRRGM